MGQSQVAVPVDEQTNRFAHRQRERPGSRARAFSFCARCPSGLHWGLSRRSHNATTSNLRPAVRPARVDFQHRSCLRPHHRASVREPLGSGRPARHDRDQPAPRHPGRARRPQGGRHGRRRRDCRRRHAGADGADRIGSRRRSLCDRVGRQDEEVVRAQRQRTVAKITHARLPEVAGAHRDAKLRPAAGHRSRLRGRVVHAARPIWQATDEARAGARDALRARGVPAHRADRVLLAAERADPWQVSGLQRNLSRRRARAARRRGVQEPRARGHL